MAITWQEDADSRQHTGPSGINQQNAASFGASDYIQGGYPVYASAFGLSHIRALIPCAYSASGTGTGAGYEWRYIKPLVSGPAVSNPGFLKAFQQNGTTGGLVEASASSNFSAGTIDFMCFGY